MNSSIKRVLVALAVIIGVLFGVTGTAQAAPHQGTIKIVNQLDSDSAIKTQFQAFYNPPYNYNVSIGETAGEGHAPGQGLSEPTAFFVGAGWCVDYRSYSQLPGQTAVFSAWYTQVGGASGSWKSLALGNPNYEWVTFFVTARRC